MPGGDVPSGGPDIDIEDIAGGPPTTVAGVRIAPVAIDAGEIMRGAFDVALACAAIPPSHGSSAARISAALA